MELKNCQKLVLKDIDSYLDADVMENLSVAIFCYASIAIASIYIYAKHRKF